MAKRLTWNMDIEGMKYQFGYPSIKNLDLAVVIFNPAHAFDSVDEIHHPNGF